MDTASLQARIDAIPWYHEFDFGNGLRARSGASDVDAHRRIWHFIAEQLDALDFRGRSVLDVGCWDGYWSFEAERRGAHSVLATDDFSQNWSNASGILLAKELLGSRVEVDLSRSVHDLAGLGRKFDVVLFLGVYYHLFDPFHALAQIRHCCHPGTLVLIEGSEVVGLPAQTALCDFRRKTAKYLPTPGALDQLLRAAYFTPRTRTVLNLADGFTDRLGLRWCLNFVRQALRGRREKLGELAETVIYSRRVFLACTPFAGVNEAHGYRPPFGLHRYDPRFAEGITARRAA